MQTAKWSNSLAVRLPAVLVAEMGLNESDENEIRRAAEAAFEIALRAKIDTAAVLSGCTTLYSGYIYDSSVIDGLTIRNPFAAA